MNLSILVEIVDLICYYHKESGDLMVADNLKNIRKEHKLTQQDIANVLGIDRSTYAFYETGKTTPSVNTLYKLAEIYNVSIESFVGEESGIEIIERKKEIPMSVAAPFADQLAFLDKDEKMLLMCYRLIDKDRKNEAIEIMKDLARKADSDINQEFESID